MCRLSRLLGIFIVAGIGAPGLHAHSDGRRVSESQVSGADAADVSIVVTAHPKKRKPLPDIRAADFTVLENGRKQTILSVKPASEAPINLAVLIQDDLVSGVANEIRTTRQFISSLPAGSRVMVGYLTTGTLEVAQSFTTDLKRAASSLRIPRGSAAAAPFNPYVEVIEALRRFDGQPPARNLILLVSDGLDASRGLRSGSPALSIDLERAIHEAQRRGVAVFSFYAPSVGLTSISHLAVNYGQGSLNRLADETGGEAFFQGTSFVTFDPHFKELKQLIGRQWLITYRSDTAEPGTRRIEVKVDYPDVDLYHQVSYRPRSTHS